MNSIAKLFKNMWRQSSSAYFFQVASLFCMILTIQIWQIYKFDGISIFVFMIGVFCSCYTSLIAINQSIRGQLLYNTIISFMLELFAVLLLIGNYSILASYLTKEFVWILCIPLMLLLICQFIQFIYSMRNARIHIIISSEIILMIIFIAILIIVGAQFFNLWPRWDSGTYYMELNKISALNIFQSGEAGLIVCGHPAGSWVLFTLLVRLIPKLSYINALHLSNIILTIIIFVITYFILKELFSLKSNYVYPVLAFVFTSSPYILGTITNINSEKLCLAGLLVFLFGVIKKNYYICIFACYIVCNARENGVAIIAGLIFIQLIYDFYYFKKQGHISSINIFYYLVVLAIGISWLLLFLSNNWSDAMRESTNGVFYYNDDTPMFSVQISGLYIINQLKGIFLTNFTWIYGGIICMAGFIYIKSNRKDMLRKMPTQKISILLWGMILSIVVSCIYITHHNYRYYTQSILFIQLLGIWGLVYMLSKYKINIWIKNILVLSMGLLMFIQCHTTIDPIMLAIYPTIDTGNSKLAGIPWNINNLSEFQFLECANYNFQPAFFDQALDMVYENIDVANSKVLIYDGYSFGNWTGTLNSIWGLGYEYMDPPAWGVWNETGKYRELSYEPDIIINPIAIKTSSEIDDYLEQYDNLYYLELPWGDNLVGELIEKYPEFATPRRIMHGGWILNVYSIHK